MASPPKACGTQQPKAFGLSVVCSQYHAVLLPEKRAAFKKHKLWHGKRHETNSPTTPRKETLEGSAAFELHSGSGSLFDCPLRQGPCPLCTTQCSEGPASEPQQNKQKRTCKSTPPRFARDVSHREQQLRILHLPVGLSARNDQASHLKLNNNFLLQGSIWCLDPAIRFRATIPQSPVTYHLHRSLIIARKSFTERTPSPG